MGNPVAAQLLTRLIGLITNVAFHGRWSMAFVSPSGNSLGMAVVIVPIIGAVLVGDLVKRLAVVIYDSSARERTIDLAATLAWVRPNVR
jgi:hypothetical protein